MVKKTRFQQPQRRKGNQLHHSKFTVEYFISVEDITVNDIPREVMKFELISDEIPEGSVEFSALLPNLSGEAMDLIISAETEWTRHLCTEITVIEHAINLLSYACETVASRTAMLDAVSKGGDPVKLRRERNQNNKRIAENAGERLRREVAKILEVPDGRRSDYTFTVLPIVHERLKSLWQGAHEIAKSAQRSRSPERRKAWREEVTTFFEKNGFPDVANDLVTRLDTPDNWPDDLAATLRKHGAEGKPYDIALEDAARLTAYPGYLPYALTLRQLKAHLKETKQWLGRLRARKQKSGEIVSLTDFTQKREKLKSK